MRLPRPPLDFAPVEFAVVVVLAIGLVCSCATLAFGQHDHGKLPAWLLAHPDFASCCNLSDCGPLSVPTRYAERTNAAGDVVDGWIMEVAAGRWFFFPRSQAKKSGDRHSYACIPHLGEPEAYVRCLWMPETEL